VDPEVKVLMEKSKRSQKAALRLFKYNELIERQA
jgi:hypothetical protein